jgi:hypothetical protein
MLVKLHSGDTVPVQKCFQSAESGIIWAKLPPGIVLPCGEDPKDGKHVHLKPGQSGYVVIQHPEYGRTMRRVKNKDQAKPDKESHTQSDSQQKIHLDSAHQAEKGFTNVRNEATLQYSFLEIRMMWPGPLAFCLTFPELFSRISIHSIDNINQRSFARQCTEGMNFQEVPWDRMTTEVQDELIGRDVTQNKDVDPSIASQPQSDEELECDENPNPCWMRQSTPYARGTALASTVSAHETEEYSSGKNGWMRQSTPCPTGTAKACAESESEKATTASGTYVIEGSAEVSKFLQEVGLQQYTDVLLEQGYDEMAILRDMEEKHFLQLGLLPGHTLKLMRIIKATR